MKALIYKGPYDVAVEELPVPELKAGHALVKVKASGICGSDIHGFTGKTGRKNPGVIMGHEFSGEVIAVAEDVTNVTIGSRVVVEPTINCQKCRCCAMGHTQYCTSKSFLGVFSENGGFAQYIAVPSRLLFEMPDDTTYIQGALVEPVSVSKCSVEKIDDYTGKTVVIVGAGTIGLLALCVLKTKKPQCIIVTDLSKNRLNAAKELGADYVINPQSVNAADEIKRLTGGQGADVSIEAVGLSASVDTAISCLRSEGSCVWVGNSAKDITVNMQQVVTRGITIYGTYTYSHQEFGKTIRDFNKLGIPVEKVVSRTISLEESPEMLKDLAGGNDKLIKTVIVF